MLPLKPIKALILYNTINNGVMNKGDKNNNSQYPEYFDSFSAK